MARREQRPPLRLRAPLRLILAPPPYLARRFNGGQRPLPSSFLPAIQTQEIIMKQLHDSVVVITGASSGIGRATASKYARAGANLVLAARRKNVLKEVAEECERHGS